jgi:putative OPT family oligopeptide transporter
MVVKSNLPYPEGVAAAVILKTANKKSSDGESQAKSGVKLLALGAGLSSVFTFCTSGLRVLFDGFTITGKVGAAVFSLGTGYSFALLGAGLLIGIGGGFSLLVGTILCWGVGVPVLTSILPNPDALAVEDFSSMIWATKLRFAGAGCIAISALWTLIVLVKPIVKGLLDSMELAKEAKSGQIDSRNTDLSFKQMIIYTVISILIICGVFYKFTTNIDIPALWSWSFIILGTLLAVLIGFLLAASCGYMAGLIGSSSSPISGITIISVVVISLCYLVLSGVQGMFNIEGGRDFVTAFTLFTATVVNATACISNDNLQDLKTGQLVGASPKHQQVALIIGTIIGAFVIAPVLELLYNSYGFPGAMPRANMDPSLALNAPQATLMASIAKGIFNHHLEWTYIIIGLILGALLIVLNLFIKKITKNKIFIAPLAVGLGIYLPSSVNVVIIIGAIASYFIVRRIKLKFTDEEEQKNRLISLDSRNNLMAAGLIVGESLMGVLMAFVLTASISTGGSDAPLAIDLGLNATVISVISFVIFFGGLIYVLRKIASGSSK